MREDRSPSSLERLAPDLLRIERTTGAEEVLVRSERLRLRLERGSTLVVRRRAPDTPRRAGVLLLHGYAQNHAAWHIPERSFANHLAASGLDVFSLDLRGSRRSLRLGARRPRRFAEYLERDLPRALELVAAASGDPRVLLVGHSLGGALACALAGRASGRVLGVVSIAGVYGYRACEGWIHAISAIARAVEWAVPRALPLPTHWVGDALRRSRRLLDGRAWHPVPLQAWAPGSVEPDVLESYLRRSFEPATFGVSAFIARVARGGASDPLRPLVEPFERADVPLLVIAGEDDRLVASSDTLLAFERSHARDKAARSLPRYGHVDLLVGRDAPRDVWPEVTGWLLARAARSPRTA